MKVKKGEIKIFQKLGGISFCGQNVPLNSTPKCITVELKTIEQLFPVVFHISPIVELQIVIKFLFWISYMGYWVKTNLYTLYAA